MQYKNDEADADGVNLTIEREGEREEKMLRNDAKKKRHLLSRMVIRKYLLLFQQQAATQLMFAGNNLSGHFHAR